MKDPTSEPANGANQDQGLPPELLAGNFDGFITPEGRFVAIQDADTMFRIITGRTEDLKKVVDTLRAFAQECLEK